MMIALLNFKLPNGKTVQDRQASLCLAHTSACSLATCALAYTATATVLCSAATISAKAPLFVALYHHGLVTAAVALGAATLAVSYTLAVSVLSRAAASLVLAVGLAAGHDAAEKGRQCCAETAEN
eukprot:9170-Heterococcus_DN1.PRE.4